MAAPIKDAPAAAPGPARPRAVTRWIALNVVAALSCIAACMVLLIRDDRPVGFHFLVITGIYMAVGLIPPMRLRLGADHNIQYSFGEFATLFGVVLGPAYLVPIAGAIASARELGTEWLSRQHERQRLAFNFGNSLIGTAVTVLVAETFPAPWSFIPAVLIGSIVTVGSLARVVSLHTGAPFWVIFWSGWQPKFGIPVGAAVAVSLLLFLPTGQWIVAAIPAVVFISARIADEWTTHNRERTRFEKVDSFVEKLVGQTDEIAIIEAALKGADDIFSVRRIELCTYPSPGNQGILYTHDTRTGEFLVTPLPSDFAAPDIDDAQLVVTADDAYAPLKAAQRHIGHLRLTWSKYEKRSTDKSRLVKTFASNVSLNLMTARQHVQMRKVADEKAHEAEHDMLTGLGNRSMLYSRGPGVLIETQDIGKHVALLLFDLDGFKRINDTLGHAAGDQVIRYVGRRIRDCIRRSDIAIRLGGDEFAILAVDLSHPSDSEIVANKIINELTKTIPIEGINLTVEASVGIAVASPEIHTIEELLKQADIAMYEAKARGRGRWFRYRPDADTNSAEQLTLANDLHQALDAQQLVLHYQPQIDLINGDVVGMEALVRWQHPEFGLLFPDKFVPLAEHSGLITKFTLAIIDMAVRDHSRMRVPAEACGDEVTMSVNLSARNLLDQALPEAVEEILARWGVPARQLVIEITETAAPGDSASVERVLGGLKRLGCQVSIDDFGTGYSSIQSLRQRRQQVNEIKIDRTFVADILGSEEERTMVQAIIQMAHGMQCRVVAEGVEDVEMLKELRRMGCNIGQGYHIARPAPLETVQGWLDTWMDRRVEHCAIPVPLGAGSRLVMLPGERIRRA